MAVVEKMSNEEIAAEFETLLGGGSEEEDFETSEEEEIEGETSEESEEESESESESEEEEDEESEEDNEEEESEEQPSTSVDKQKSRQNYAFAEQRQQIKKQNDLIKGLGKLIGFDDKASVDEIGDKLKEVLLERESKEQNVPVDLLKRIEKAEEILQENDRIKLEKNVTEAFADLIEKHGLEQEQVDEFTDYLISEGKNPMEDPNVDIHAEYLKLHWQDMLETAAEQAVQKENARKKKVSEKSSTKTPASADEGGDDSKIDSVKSLDDLFDKMDL